MSLTKGFADFLVEQMAGLGRVSVRRMFGGAGLFVDGLIFAILVDDTLYLKADEEGRARFEAEGLAPFTYVTKDGHRTLTSYWRAPERCLDDPGEMVEWARAAVTAAKKSAAKPKGRKKK